MYDGFYNPLPDAEGLERPSEGNLWFLPAGKSCPAGRVLYDRFAAFQTRAATAKKSRAPKPQTRA